MGGLWVNAREMIGLGGGGMASGQLGSHDFSEISFSLDIKGVFVARDWGICYDPIVVFPVGRG